ncbi:hypothetical protein [Curtobacterium luteum]|uniref:hypothetical protein n=1 Tax=Curtobacterium luteum TaxID=33881 RepID=UPI000B1D2023|nr:hypothetical protein [Curtobacterium luteum]
MTDIAVGIEATWNRTNSLDEPLCGKVVAIDTDLQIAKIEGTRGWVHLSAIKPADA